MKMWKPSLGPYASALNKNDSLSRESDSGYAESSESATSSTPEPIYYSTSEILKQESRESYYQTTANPRNQMDNFTSGDKILDPGFINEQELMQLENFYKGHKTQVYVCKSLANLYLRSSPTLLGLTRYSSQPDLCRTSQERRQDSVTDWELRYTGIPVILHDSGTTKSRDQRRIQIVLAERGTGFALWRDIIDHLSNYESPSASFHTMRISTDHRLIVGFSFDSPEAARFFYSHLERLTSDPANISLSLPKKNPKPRFCRFWPLKNLKNHKKDCESSNEKKKKKLVRKNDISMPCFFQHVTAVEPQDQHKFFSLQAFLM